MKGRLLLFLTVGLWAALTPAASRAVSPPRPLGSLLVGTWKIDPAHSTELSPWKTLDLVITLEGAKLNLRRVFGWGLRTYEENVSLDFSLEVNLVPVPYWPDNRHLGAYAGGDKIKRVQTRWLEEGRLLRLSADFIVDTQQGPHPLNILSDYKVSTNGAVLTLTEIRSSRNRPIVYQFNRVAPKPSASEAKP